MSIDNPFSNILVILLPLFLGSYFFAYKLSKQLFNNKLHQFVFSMPICTALFLIIITYSSLLLKDFNLGIIIGTSLTFTVFVIAAYLFKKIDGEKVTPMFSTSESSKIMWATAICTTILVFFISINGNFHDEQIVNGHKTLVAQFQNNIFPPRNIISPDDQLRYHFGFDVICGAITALTRCSIDNSIDILTAICWFYIWLMLWIIGELLFKVKYAGLLVAVCTLFGGGLSYIFGIFYSDASILNTLLGTVDIIDIPINPPLFSYFFQHPFSVGILFSLTIIYIYINPKIERVQINFRYLIISLLFIALYFSQTVMFITLLIAISYLETFKRKNYSFIFYALSIVLIIYLSRSGLIFTKLIAKHDSDIIFRFWPKDESFLRVIAWFSGSMGLLVIFGAIGLYFLKNSRRLFFYLSLFGIVIPIFCKYRYAWDIVKFTTSSSVYLGILSGGAIATLFNMKVNQLRKFLYVSLAVILASSFFYIVIILYFQNFSGPNGWKNRDSNLNENYVELINWARKQPRFEGMYFIDPTHAKDFLITSGLPTIYPENFVLATSFGTDTLRLRRFVNIFKSHQLTLADCDNFNVHYIVVDKQKEMEFIQIFETGKYIKVNEFGTLNVFERVKK